MSHPVVLQPRTTALQKGADNIAKENDDERKRKQRLAGCRRPMKKMRPRDKKREMSGYKQGARLAGASDLGPVYGTSFMLRRLGAAICGVKNSSFRKQLASESRGLPYNIEQQLVLLCGGSREMPEGDYAVHFMNIKARDEAQWTARRLRFFPDPRSYDPPLDAEVIQRIDNIIECLNDCHEATQDAIQDHHDRELNRSMALNKQAENELTLTEAQGGVLGFQEETVTSTTASAEDIAASAKVLKDVA